VPWRPGTPVGAAGRVTKSAMPWRLKHGLVRYKVGHALAAKARAGKVTKSACADSEKTPLASSLVSEGTFVTLLAVNLIRQAISLHDFTLRLHSARARCLKIGRDAIEKLRRPGA